VLLVDDQRLTHLVLSGMLAAETDIALHWCQVAADAPAIAGKIHPDVILQDLVMPDVDGWTMLSRYREHPATSRTPVCFLSADDDDVTRARASANGAAGYLVKMPPKSEVIACLRRLAAARSGPRPNDSFEDHHSLRTL
jgi:PleD family two-component response regulator